MTINLADIKRILIIQYQPFGDVLLNTGYMPALRKKFPEARIDYLVRKPFQVVLDNNPYLDELIVFQNYRGLRYLINRFRLFKKIYERKYDLVIDQMRSTGSAQFTFFSRARYRLGFVHQRWRWVYNIRPSRQKLRYYSSLKFDLLKPLGIQEEKHELFFDIKDESFQYIDAWLKDEKIDSSDLIVFSPGSPVAGKKWSAQNYARLADLVIENTGHKVVLLWAPDEKKDVDHIKKLMKNDPVVAPTTDFNQAAAMLKRAKMLVCNDGGINHLSVATKTISISIFGMMKPTRWSPQIFPGHYYFYNPDHNKGDNTFGITAQRVFAKIKEIIKNNEYMLQK